MATHGAYGPPGAELQRLYDADAVDHYIAQLQAHIQDLQRQVGDAVALAEEAQAKAAAAGKTEALLGRALLTAQQAADQTMADAERQAELIVAGARQEADRLLADVRTDAQRIVDEAHETVEAVFAALNAQREPEAAGEPDADLGMFPPPAPPSVSAAPDPATREPDIDEPTSAGWDGPDNGTIVDLRPARPPVVPAAPGGHEPPGGADWALSLGGTGTEGPLPVAAPRPVLERRDPEPVAEARPRVEAEPAAENRPRVEAERAAENRPRVEADRAAEAGLASEPDWDTGAPPAGDAMPAAEPWSAERTSTAVSRPASAELLERWRVARNGGSGRDEAFLSRPGQLESLADGSYVSLLRGDGPAPTARAPEPPPRRWRRRSR